jgi:hypothetical protein
MIIEQQPELYTRETGLERVIELTAWLRNEIDAMRLRIRTEQIELRQLELAMRKVQDIVFDLQQDELF